MVNSVEAEVRLLPEYIPEMFKLTTLKDIVEKSAASAGPLGYIFGKTPGELTIFEREGVIKDNLVYKQVHPWDIFDWFMPVFAFFNGLFSKPKTQPQRRKSIDEILAEIRKYKELGSELGLVPVFDIYGGTYEFLGFEKPKRRVDPRDEIIGEAKKWREYYDVLGYDVEFEIENGNIKPIPKKKRKEKKDKEKIMGFPVYYHTGILPYYPFYYKDENIENFLKLAKEYDTDTFEGVKKAIKSLDEYEKTKLMKYFTDVHKKYMETLRYLAKNKKDYYEE